MEMYAYFKKSTTNTIKVDYKKLVLKIVEQELAPGEVLKVVGLGVVLREGVYIESIVRYLRKELHKHPKGITFSVKNTVFNNQDSIVIYKKK